MLFLIVYSVIEVIELIYKLLLLSADYKVYCFKKSFSSISKKPVNKSKVSFLYIFQSPYLLYPSNVSYSKI